MKRVSPPFLELSYYVGPAGVPPTLAALVKDLPPGEPPTLFELTDPVLGGTEQIAVYDGIVLLRTCGDAFCGPQGSKLADAKRLGPRVYNRFVAVADLIPCIYGAILIEYSLETPEQLHNGCSSLAFRSFYLDEEALGRAAIEAAITLAGAHAYVEKRSNGVYISTRSWFNPRGRDMRPPDDDDPSARIAAVVGRAARKLSASGR